MAARTTLFLAGLIVALVGVVDLQAQDRDFGAERLVLDDDAADGTLNIMTIQVDPTLSGDRTLTIPDPGPGGGTFLLANNGSLGITEIETPNPNETLRLNPSGDLVQVGNTGSPATSNGLAVAGDLSVEGSNIDLSTGTASGAPNVSMSSGTQSIDIESRFLNITVIETVRIDGNLVVTGDLDVQGRLRAHSSGNRIGSGHDATQLTIYGDFTGGNADHLYVRGNVRLSDELRIGTGNNTSTFQTGTQASQINYTLPTSLPAAAASGTSMGRGVMETSSTGVMSWRNAGTVSGAVDFASTADGATNDQTLTLTGAAVGDLVVLGTPEPTVGTSFEAWVSAPDTVTIRFTNDSGGVLDPASATFNAMVIRP